ncbi:MAG: class A beta-lactamase-related serine hydrolase, partial [Actinomycetota bacterium]|nr:class A beta-lactamase-related serine hydrolase [Actinomycetota bacterium]
RYLETLGFTGAAVVTTDTWSATVSDLYDEAIRYSSNDAYDCLVEIAGVDWLNEVFLTPANGFTATVIQRSYEDGSVISSPQMTITEDGRSVDIPARTPEVDLGVPDAGNRSDLAEMVDSVRRVTLDAELPPGERLGLAPADVALMTDALLGADGFLEPGVVDALGDDSIVYDKPGWVLGESCIDVGLVVDRADDRRFLVGIASPDDGTECEAVPEIAAVVLSSLTGS